MSFTEGLLTEKQGVTEFYSRAGATCVADTAECGAANPHQFGVLYLL
jgi:hypothetical protein